MNDWRDLSPMTWAQDAKVAMNALIESGERFTSDDVEDRVGLPDAGHKPNGRNSAVGPLFREAHSAGRIEVVGTAKSRAPHRKGGLIQVWQGVARPTLFDQGSDTP